MDRTFRVPTAYMPTEAAGLDIVDPHLHSMQWSRRFIGLKLFLSLAVAGWEGYEAAIREQTRLGQRLRALLEADGWEVVNDTPLPVVCFVDGRGPEGRTAAALEEMAAAVVASGAAWINVVRLGETGPALRACITNYRTRESDLEALVRALARARELSHNVGARHS
jgi:selenocysteine lyase/cysteine desulfurase